MALAVLLAVLQLACVGALAYFTRDALRRVRLALRREVLLNVLNNKLVEYIADPSEDTQVAAHRAFYDVRYEYETQTEVSWRTRIPALDEEWSTRERA